MYLLMSIAGADAKLGALDKLETFIYTLTERTEKTWRSVAVAFITGFSPLEGNQKNLGITAMGRLFCRRSVQFRQL